MQLLPPLLVTLEPCRITILGFHMVPKMMLIQNVSAILGKVYPQLILYTLCMALWFGVGYLPPETEMEDSVLVININMHNYYYQIHVHVRK